MKALASCSGQFKMIIDLNLNLKKDLIFIQLHSHKQTMKHLHTYYQGHLKPTFPTKLLVSRYNRINSRHIHKECFCQTQLTKPNI